MKCNRITATEGLYPSNVTPTQVQLTCINAVNIRLFVLSTNFTYFMRIANEDTGVVRIVVLCISSIRSCLSFPLYMYSYFVSFILPSWFSKYSYYRAHFASLRPFLQQRTGTQFPTRFICDAELSARLTSAERWPRLTG
jgi:hypothetical protein